MISIDQVVQVVVYLVVVGAIFGLLYWVIDFAGIPEPFNKSGKVFLAVCGVLLLIGLILSLIGHPVVRFTKGKQDERSRSYVVSQSVEHGACAEGIQSGEHYRDHSGDCEAGWWMSGSNAGLAKGASSGADGDVGA